MRQYIDTLQDVQGNALVGASVLVQNYIGGANASIFSDNGLTPILTSTVATGADGQFSFFAADGDYNLVMSKNATVFKTQSPVTLFDGTPQVTYADTGIANAYAIANSSLEKALRVGLRASFQALNANTGASTFAYNGLPAKPMVIPGGIPLGPGAIVATGIYGLEYDGASWQTRNVNTVVTPGNVLTYGADPAGVLDSTSAFQAARLAATAGNIEMLIPGGTYKISSTLVWGFSQLQVRATGRVYLNFTNSGQCITIDGGAAGGALEGIGVQGYIKVFGNATTSDAWYLRAVARSKLQMRAGDCTTGLRCQWAVLNSIDFVCSVNDTGGFAVLTPTTGMYLDQRGVGETTASNIFNLPMLEGITTGVGIGIDLQGTYQNQFFFGTSESNKIGARQANSNNVGNTFHGTDFELNSTQDILVTAGSSLTCLNINAFSTTATQPNIDLPGGDNTTFVAGLLRQVNVQAGSTGTTFNGCQFPNTGGLGITGAGLYESINSQLINPSGRAVTAKQSDIVGEKGTFLPTISGNTTPGVQTYSVQAGFYQKIGRMVIFSAQMILTANGGGAAGIANFGFPGIPSTRNAANCLANFNVNDYQGVTLGAAGRTLSVTCQPAANTGFLIETDTGSVRNGILITAVAANAQLLICGSYLTD